MQPPGEYTFTRSSAEGYTDGVIVQLPISEWLHELQPGRATAPLGSLRLRRHGVTRAHSNRGPIAMSRRQMSHSAPLSADPVPFGDRYLLADLAFSLRGAFYNSPGRFCVSPLRNLRAPHFSPYRTHLRSPLFPPTRARSTCRLVLICLELSSRMFCWFLRVPRYCRRIEEGLRSGPARRERPNVSSPEGPFVRRPLLGRPSVKTEPSAALSLTGDGADSPAALSETASVANWARSVDGPGSTAGRVVSTNTTHTSRPAFTRCGRGP